MTKGEMRKLRKDARAQGRSIEFNAQGHPEFVTPRSKSQERKHATRMHRWARSYDKRNGAPEGEWDR